MGQTIREAAIFLYIQWYILSLERFNALKKQMKSGIVELDAEDTTVTQLK